ncbi:hypothetical protein DJ82_07290 [Halorubrum sp. Ib24]|nr:hypothetical protein DJ82_07290 [Halorubrum sp. Ib24]
MEECLTRNFTTVVFVFALMGIGRLGRGRDTVWLALAGIVVSLFFWIWLKLVGFVIGPSDALILSEFPVARDVVSQLLRALFAVGTAIAAIRYLDVPSPLDWMEVRPPDVWDLGYILLGVFLLIIAALGSNILIQNVLGLERTMDGASLSNAVLWSRVGTLLLLVGPAEEVMFRGIIQRSLRDVIGRWPAILFAGGLFGFLHIGIAATAPGDMLWLVALSLLGVILGWVYERTNNLVVPALAHGSFNSLTTALPLLLG